MTDLLAGCSDLRHWQERRANLRRWWLDYLRPPAFAPLAPGFEVLAEDRDAGVLRQRIRYLNEPDQNLEAYLLTPLDATPGGRPGVVFLHSTSDDTIRQGAGLGGDPTRAFGLDLARRGCVVLCPRNMLWSGGGPLAACPDVLALARTVTTAVMARYDGQPGMAKMLSDARRAVDILQGVPAVDPARLGCAGHSLGAKQALFLAAFDERIAAAVSSEGGIGLALCNWDAPWYLGPACRQADFGHDLDEVLALVAPRAFLLIGGDHADGEVSRPFIDAVTPVYRLHGAADRLELFNHHQGHSVPPPATARLVDWLVSHLRA